MNVCLGRLVPYRHKQYLCVKSDFDTEEIETFGYTSTTVELVWLFFPVWDRPVATRGLDLADAEGQDNIVHCEQ